MHMHVYAAQPAEVELRVHTFRASPMLTWPGSPLPHSPAGSPSMGTTNLDGILSVVLPASRSSIT